jgi:hypothetical protein
MQISNVKLNFYNYYFILCDDFFDPKIFNKGRSEVESGKDRSSLHSFLAYMISLDRETDPSLYFFFVFTFRLDIDIT